MHLHVRLQRRTNLTDCTASDAELLRLRTSLITLLLSHEEMYMNSDSGLEYQSACTIVHHTALQQDQESSVVPSMTIINVVNDTTTGRNIGSHPSGFQTELDRARKLIL